MSNNFYKNWKAAVINERYSLKDTIKNLNKTALQVCFVTKKKKVYRNNFRWGYTQSLIKRL